MKVIAFTGMPWSGKSEAVKIAQEKGFYVFRMGDFVWEEVKKRNMKLNSENVGIIANEMRHTYGNDIWAKKTLNKIKTLSNQEIVIVDGVRSIYELDYFKSYFNDDFLLVSINADDQIRHHRAVTRKREDDSIDINLIKCDKDLVIQYLKSILNEIIESIKEIKGKNLCLKYFSEEKIYSYIFSNMKLLNDLGLGMFFLENFLLL